jgi:hypothetical protein
MLDEKDEAEEPDGAEDIKAGHPLLAACLASFIAGIEMGRERIDGAEPSASR